MYAVDPPLPVDELPAGAYLVAGPPLSYKYELIRELLAVGARDGDGSLFVSTNKGATSLARDFGWEDGPPEDVSVIDCISQQSGGADAERPNVSYVASPGDLTGIGMYTSRQMNRLQEEVGVDDVRVALYSASTLFMYEELETVLRFLNVFSHRLKHDGALGLLTLNTDSHEDTVVEAALGVADGVVEVREREGRGEVSVVPPESDTRSEWRQF
jgi:KaiC/GvpD/RAD55 family RecA-like ATPase